MSSSARLAVVLVVPVLLLAAACKDDPGQERIASAAGNISVVTQADGSSVATQAYTVVSGDSLTLVFESFAFKHGVPSDADFVFDVRVLPNPYYDRELRPQTGRDEPVARFLEAQPEVRLMLSQISAFIAQWLPNFASDQRSYLTVAIGCTGGQHRSVYLVETLCKQFAYHGQVLKRHRELDAK